MKRSLLFACALGLCVAGCGPKEQAKKPADEDSVLSGNPAMAPLDYLAAQGKAKRVAVKTLTAAELTQAIQKFAAMEDRYPRDLNELVAERYLMSPPTAPAGMMWSYNPQNGQARLVPAQTAPGTAPAPASPQRSLPGLKNLPQQPRTLPE